MMEVMWTFDGIPPMREQLSEVPDQWREATVIERTRETGVVQCADGSRVGFTSGQLLRNRTHWENTQIGATVWLTERGGISAHPPNPHSPRQCYDDILRAQVQHMADEIDKRFTADPTWKID